MGRNPYEIDMIPFPTKRNNLTVLASIITEMEAKNLDKKFLAKILELASYDEGIFDLVKMWKDEPNQREEIIIEIQRSIQDYCNEPLL